MNTTTIVIAFFLVVLAIVIRINTTPWNADEQWKRQADRLRAQGIVGQRPDDWDAQVTKRRSQAIYIVLGLILLLTIWFIGAMISYS